jgi:hypothetical protein
VDCKPGEEITMSDEVMHWFKIAARFGAAIALALSIVAYVRFRNAESKTPRPFVYKLLMINMTREFYIFGILCGITILLVNISFSLN